MKRKLYLFISLYTLTSCYIVGNAQSNKSLSNLTAPTAVNQNLLPDINNSKDLGDNTHGWKNIYFTNRIYLNKKPVLYFPGTNNFFAGLNAGKEVLTGVNNTGVGQYALGSISSGVNNTANGYSVLYYNSSGKDNTANGYFSLYQNVTGSFNTATGSWALYSNTAGNYNTAYGYSALWQNKTGNDNVAIGKYAMYNNNAGYSNIAMGTAALYSSSTTNKSIAIGDSALYYQSGNISPNIAIGSKALFSNTTGYLNTANGFEALYSNTTGIWNVGVGSYALNSNTSGSKNIATGVSALRANTSGSSNIALGDLALSSNTTGYSNVAIGTHALNNFIKGNNTVAVGDSALFNFTGSSYSDETWTTAVGSKALFNATSGYENTAIGTRALYNTTKGSINTAIGVSAMFQNTEGVFNTAVGVTALSSNTTGKYNTGIGYSALDIIQTSIQNTALGAYAGPNSFSLISNSTSVGYLARATASNQVRLGNADVTSIGGQVGWSIFSDGRYKKNIKEDVKGLAFINALRPITYTVDVNGLKAYFNKGIKDKDDEYKPRSDYSNEEAGKIIYNGFVAQEVETAAKKLGFEFSGVDKPKDENGLYGLRYDNFVVPLVKAVQELSKKNDSLNSKMQEFEDLKTENTALIKRIEKLESMVLQNNANGVSLNANINTLLTNASLEQNIPNPFTNTTTIRYTLPQKFTKALIVITDNSGKIIKQANVAGTGKGVVNVDAFRLLSGTYYYALIVDGKLIDSKQMEHFK